MDMGSSSDSLESPPDLREFEIARDRGNPMCEVFSVKLEALDNIDAEGYGKLYGTIKFSRDIEYLLYDRKREDYESIKPGENLTLTGPYRCITALDDFSFDFDLWNYDNGDQKAIHGYIDFCVFRSGKIYNVLRTDRIVGEHGSLIVNYVVFHNAVHATIEVKLINNGNGENPTHVYGLLAARDKVFEQESQLFQITEEAKGCIKMRPGERIPLLRSAVAASLDSNLTVWAKLYESEGHEIANGSAEFTPELSGTITKNITGDYGEIEVKVTWLDFYP